MRQEFSFVLNIHFPVFFRGPKLLKTPVDINCRVLLAAQTHTMKPVLPEEILVNQNVYIVPIKTCVKNCKKNYYAELWEILESVVSEALTVHTQQLEK